MRRRVITRRPMLVVLACMLVSLRAVMALATTPITLEIVGDWRVQVTGHLPDGDRHAVLDVPPADIVTVVNERHATLPDFNPAGPP